MSQKIVILGAGPAGLALAMKLLRRSDLDLEVIVIEEKPYVGGLTASFEYGGLCFDYGSHRLHPTTGPEILEDLRALLGSDLLLRHRNGRIRLRGRFVKFPLNVLDLGIHLPPSFAMAIARDIVVRFFRPRRGSNASFSDALLSGLGQTICTAFYFPYARKLWGLEPQEIAAVQAQKRVSANTVAKIVGKIMALVPGFKRQGAGCFFYPRNNFGQISQALAQEVRKLRGKIQLSTRVKEIRLQNCRQRTILLGPSTVVPAADKAQGVSEGTTLSADFVFSTIPITDLVSYLRPEPPADVRRACEQVKYRDMVLCYLVLETDRFTPYDAHYFPETDTIFSRVSEPKNYTGSPEPYGMTGLCAEIPCSFGDDTWNASEDGISNRVISDLAHVGLPVRVPVKARFVRRVRCVYPVYDLNFERRFQAVDDYLDQISGLVSLGRQGLFAHDNTHHTMEMAYRASDCLKPGLVWDSELWKSCRKQFDTHCVED